MRREERTATRRRNRRDLFPLVWKDGFNSMEMFFKILRRLVVLCVLHKSTLLKVCLSLVDQKGAKGSTGWHIDKTQAKLV